MLSAGWIFMIIFVTLETVLAYILSLFILVAGVNSLRTGQKLNPSDVIHLVIGVVNVVFQCLLTLQGLLSKLYFYLLCIREFYGPITVGTLTLTYFTFWLTAWLCIYYCITISTFKQPFFAWTKRNISMYLPHLLLLSATGCFLTSLPSIWMATVQVSPQSSVNSSLDSKSINCTVHVQPLYIQSVSFVGCYAPFLLILASIIVTNSSLMRHLWKMRQKESGLSQTKVQAHVNAIRTMWLFLTISIIFCISEILLFSLNPNPEDYRIVVSWLVFKSFPAAESLVIIFSNPKLRRQIMVKILCFYQKLQM
ncbi:taste receptor type 2 member 40-like [Dendrobates tinctorius]|uniref:taste receptor type 2 member 40-like n=1 Tax=Dendrobates tinctorius TaxID=92724 RepID=UPI003CCA4C2C